VCGVLLGVMSQSASAFAQDEPTNLASLDLLTVRYSDDLQGDRLVIDVQFPYRDLYLQAGPVPGLPAVGSPFTWTFPEVSVKLQNNTDDVVALKTATVEMLTSTGGLDAPLLVWDDLSFAQLVIRNEGWIGVRSVALDVDIAPVERCQGYPDLTNAAHHLALPDFDDGTKVPLSAYVSASLQNSEKLCV
jgi:hypothetical protein